MIRKRVSVLEFPPFNQLQKTIDDHGFCSLLDIYLYIIESFFRSARLDWHDFFTRNILVFLNGTIAIITSNNLISNDLNILKCSS